MPELCLKVVTRAPQPLPALRPDIPPAMVEIIERCLQKDPAQRYANAAELASALEPLAPPDSRLTVERAACAMAGHRDAAPLPSAPADRQRGNARARPRRRRRHGTRARREAARRRWLREKASGPGCGSAWAAVAAVVGAGASSCATTRRACASRTRRRPRRLQHRRPVGAADHGRDCARRSRRRGRSRRSGDDRGRLGRPRRRRSVGSAAAARRPRRRPRRRSRSRAVPRA